MDSKETIGRKLEDENCAKLVIELIAEEFIYALEFFLCPKNQWEKKNPNSENN